MERIREFVRDEDGQDIIEYSILLVLIGVAALVVLSAMGQSVTEIFNKVAAKVDHVNNAIE